MATENGIIFVYRVSYEYKVGRKWITSVTHYSDWKRANAIHENNIRLQESRASRGIKDYRGTTMETLCVFDGPGGSTRENQNDIASHCNQSSTQEIRA